MCYSEHVLNTACQRESVCTFCFTYKATSKWKSFRPSTYQTSKIPKPHIIHHLPSAIKQSRPTTWRPALFEQAKRLLIKTVEEKRWLMNVVGIKVFATLEEYPQGIGWFIFRYRKHMNLYLQVQKNYKK